MARILVVDDEPLIAMLAEAWLTELGHAPVGPAHNLAAGLALAETAIDGAIIDVSLRRDAGYPIAQALMARNIPFVLATGHIRADVDPAYQGLEPLLKPFQFEAFERSVRALLSARAGDAAETAKLERSA